MRGLGQNAKVTTRRATRKHLASRIVQLFVSLWLFGMSLGLMVQANLGLAPWDVLHQGLAGRFGVQIGSVVIAVGVLLMLLWIPLREKPGLGTLANVLLVGLSLNWTLTWLPAPEELWLRILMMIGGVVGNGILTAAYIGARMGPGPRDGLMTGLMRRTGRSARLIRTVIEVSALVLGVILGGTVGVGTLLFAFGVGPVVHHFMPIFDRVPKARLVEPVPETLKENP